MQINLLINYPGIQNFPILSAVLVNAEPRANDRSRVSRDFLFLFHGRQPRGRDCIQEGSSNDDYESPIRVIAASWDSVKSRRGCHRPRDWPSSSFAEQRGRIRYGEYRDSRRHRSLVSATGNGRSICTFLLSCSVLLREGNLRLLARNDSVLCCIGVRVFKLNVADEESVLVACFVSR